ncbi:retrotransposon hot spot (RHS) protein [Trypanosoma conorhini]|uniref:Retrotransposon hot spot (RHS) protein n=1 Tax=Trypanosoma conorhini TaxID=83891 RepID=A0A3R7LYU3_9TRYP|nr:retrotransposon hot spot (RHS) protein [Trypanosoma conorhini]RNF05967.1 retrotransposon hot spot (RHS) protein [Trypanosoma conorhini]
MEVKAGQAAVERWVCSKDGSTLQAVHDAEQFRAPRPMLKILSPEKGWPCSLREELDVKDCYVNCEVERVWRIVQGDPTGEFGTEDLEGFNEGRRLLIGTPGTGKSMAAGSYLLCQLLRRNDGQLHVVVYCLGGELTYVFGKTNNAVAEHASAGSITGVINDLAGHEKSGYIINGVDAHGHGPTEDFQSPKSWGVNVLSSPNENNFKAWEKANQAARIVMNCQGENDVKAMCAWETRHSPLRMQVEHWEMVKKHMSFVGPVLRCAFDKAAFEELFAGAHGAVNSIDSSNADYYMGVEFAANWTEPHVSHKVVNIVRLTRSAVVEAFYDEYLSDRLATVTMLMVAKLRSMPLMLKLLLRRRDAGLPVPPKRFGMVAFTFGGFAVRVPNGHVELPLPGGGRAGYCVVKLNRLVRPAKLLNYRALKTILMEVVSS